MFSKSKTQRFRDNVTCGPPVGSYNIDLKESRKLTTFQKSERFKDQQKDTTVDSSCDFSLQRCDFSKSTLLPPQKQSTCKKISIKKSMNELKDLDMCRKSLEADMEFQDSKIHALLEKIKNLEKEMQDIKLHSEDVEQSNRKLLDLISIVRSEKNEYEAESIRLHGVAEVLKQKVAAIEEDVLQKQEYIVQMERNADEKQKTFEQQKSNLCSKLELSQNLNCDFREQLESVEVSMTSNIRCLSEKYEELEGTLGSVHTDYRHRLERSNSLLEKTKEASQKNQVELKTLEERYSELKVEHDEVVMEKDELEKGVIKQNQLINQLQERKLELNEEFKSLEASNTKVHHEMEVEIQHLQEKITRELEQKISATKLFDEQCLQVSRLEEEGEHMKKVNQRLTEELNEIEKNQSEASKENERIQDELADSNELLIKERKERDVRIQDISLEKKTMEENFLKLQDQVTRQLMETQIKLSNAEEKNKSVIDEAKFQSIQSEKEMWRKRYEDLESKVRPFMSDLDKYEFEKQALLNENQFTQSEMNKLSDKYAHLLGHQNNKQKIRHVQKLKEENYALKAEVMNLKSLVKTQRKHVSEKSSSKFDTSTAFVHNDKENVVARKPLSNRNT